MKTVIVLLYCFIALVLSLPLLLIELLIRTINEKAAAQIAFTVQRCVFKTILFLTGAKKTIIGKDHIPTNVSVLYAANHRSFYDILLAYSEMPTQTLFIAKKEIKKVPVLAQWMYFLNCLFIDRSDIKQQMGVIKSSIDYVNKGYSVYIAPEGTRNASEHLLPFKDGSFRIARKSNCPIIPVCIIGTETLLENTFPWIHKGKVLIEFGEPIYLEQLQPEQHKHLGTYVGEKVQAMYSTRISEFSQK